MKAVKIIHIAANITAFGVLGAFLIYLLVNYNGLPERIGVHFSAINGQYDVFEAKWLAFYPFVAGFGLLGILSLLSRAINRVKNLGIKKSLGFNISEKGDRVLRTFAMLFADGFKLMIAGFFSYWTYCLVPQISMDDGTTLMIFRTLALGAFLFMPVPIIIISFIFKDKGDSNDNPPGN